MADNLGMTDEELIQAYEAAKREAEGWADSTDGSAGLAYARMVAPLEKELERRGIDVREKGLWADGVVSPEQPDKAMAFDMAGVPFETEWEWVLGKYLDSPYRGSPREMTEAIRRDAEAANLDPDEAVERYDQMLEARRTTGRYVYDKMAQANADAYNAKGHRDRYGYDPKKGYVKQPRVPSEYQRAKAAFGRKLDQAQRWLDENVWKTRPKSVDPKEANAKADELYRRGAAMELAGIKDYGRLAPQANPGLRQAPLATGRQRIATNRADQKTDAGKKPIDLSTGKPVGGFTRTAAAKQPTVKAPSVKNTVVTPKTADTASYSTDKKPVF